MPQPSLRDRQLEELSEAVKLTQPTDRETAPRQIDTDKSERLTADRTGGNADCRMIAYGPSTALPPVATAGGLFAETKGKSFEQHQRRQYSKRAMKTRLDQFDAGKGLDRGRSRAFLSVWYLLKCVFLLSAWPWPIGLKRCLLRAFGAKIGEGVVIKPRVNVHFPWKLEVGDHAWIGEEVFILNFEPVKIGAQACISQRAFLCTGNHDYRDPQFSYRNAPITIGGGAWIGAGAFVGPGVEVGEEAVAAAGSVITRNVPANTIVAGNPASERGPRWKGENRKN